MSTRAALTSIQALSPADCADFVAVSSAARRAFRSGAANSAGMFIINLFSNLEDFHSECLSANQRVIEKVDWAHSKFCGKDQTRTPIRHSP
jgi:hypothetical protein